ncbi:thioesterase family protein [Sebaldella sp. S0638]|uniref:acyl-CoA thioesterase n=1 Tax=Sebaldella sp. S0638 TaxID=2957809 RepID=UPI00209F01FF|nr:thioesterase family protein [Sebaldella sp. S0638]MCP1222830.1 acyl-CoA thioesterase [Sebaldella sp. S0638]
MKEKIVEHRVYYYDTDKMGVVYHSNYLKWMEVARTEFFRDTLPYSRLEEMGVMLPVKTLNIEYFNSVKYDELIKIKIKLLEFSKIKIKFLYEIYDENFTQLKAKAETVNTFTDINGNLKRLSNELLKKLKGE